MLEEMKQLSLECDNSNSNFNSDVNSNNNNNGGLIESGKQISEIFVIPRIYIDVRRAH